MGRLPDDIVIERDNFQVYIPLATSQPVSVVLSLIFWRRRLMLRVDSARGVFAAGLAAASSSAPLAAMAST
jgi:hypothetical protein